MARGYQVLEPEQVGLLFGHQKYFNFAVMLFYWLIEQINTELMYQLTDVQIEVIQVAHHSPHNRYPCLGIHYDYPDDSLDLAPLIEATIDRLLQERPLIEFVHFISAGGKDWQGITAKIMETGNQ